MKRYLVLALVFTFLATFAQAASYTFTVPDADVATFESFAATKGSTPVAEPKQGEPSTTPWTIQQYVQDIVNGHLQYSKQLKAQSDEVSKAAKVAAYETAKPTIDKIAALKEPEAKLVTDILDGKITADSITAIEVVKQWKTFNYLLKIFLWKKISSSRGKSECS